MSLLSIGDFSRATHLSVKTLRYYHEAELLVPAEIDPGSGYRRYEVEQIGTAQLIRRFRDLGMPVADVREVLATPDPAMRTALIARHLRRLEDELGRTQAAVATLRRLLDDRPAEHPIELRHIPAKRVAAISADVATRDVGGWLQGALGELYAAVAARGVDVVGDAGGIYADGLFTDDAGAATVFLPIAGELRALGRVTEVELAAVDLAVITHDGPQDGVDRAYGALAAYVARRELSIPGPIREFYPVSRHDTTDAGRWRTEVGWPIFATGTGKGLGEMTRTSPPGPR